MVDMLQNIRAFMRVVDTGSFTAVAKENDLTTASVSRSVSTLEEQIQTILLHRTTRHLSVTQAGAKYYERMKAILAELDNANAEARNATSHPEGRIRVHCAPGVGQSHVTSILVAYQAANPDVHVDLELTQSVPNLIEDNFDLSIISAIDLPDSAHIAQTLGAAYPILLASPDYLQTHGTPVHPNDLSQHALLRLASPVSTAQHWQLHGEGAEQLVPLDASPFQVNSPEAMRIAIEAGAGIGMLATYSAARLVQNGSLVRVLPGYRLPAFQVHAIYASRRYLDAKIRTLVEFLRATLTPALAQVQRDVEVSAAAQMHRPIPPSTGLAAASASNASA